MEENDNMASRVFELIGTGILFGIIHVLTGPDHLSALSTLSANIGNCKAFNLGIRWGLGHSTGLVIVAVIIIAVSKDDNVSIYFRLPYCTFFLQT